MSELVPSIWLLRTASLRSRVLVTRFGLGREAVEAWMRPNASWALAISPLSPGSCMCVGVGGGTRASAPGCESRGTSSFWRSGLRSVFRMAYPLIGFGTINKSYAKCK